MSNVSINFGGRWYIFLFFVTYYYLNSWLLIFFQIIAPQFKHFQKLREFVKVKLPAGFPVKVDIPVLPTVSARVTFQDFSWDDGLKDSLFEIPAGYEEDPNRFPDLWRLRDVEMLDGADDRHPWVIKPAAAGSLRTSSSLRGILQQQQQQQQQSLHGLDTNSSFPSIEFPMQFNFGSTYGGSVIILFDD